MNDNQTTIMQLRDAMQQFVVRRQWGKFHQPKNLAMSLAIEAAELMEHFQWLTPAQAKVLLKNPAAKGEVADEMADVLSFLLSLANATGIDLAGAFEAKMVKNELKYPAEIVRGNYRRPKRV